MSSRKHNNQGKLIAISAADPLNLVGTVLPDERVPAQRTNRILFQDGVPVAIHVGGKSRFVDAVNAENEWEAQNLLIRQGHPKRYLKTPLQPS